MADSHTVEAVILVPVHAHTVISKYMYMYMHAYTLYLYLLVHEEFLYRLPVSLLQSSVMETDAKCQSESEVLVLDRLQQCVQLEWNPTQSEQVDKTRSEITGKYMHMYIKYSKGVLY